MGFTFDCPIGPKADIAELLYISALHQTGPFELRQDGSILAPDIQAYLISRHGIAVSEENVKKLILSDFPSNAFLHQNEDDMSIVENDPEGANEQECSNGAGCTSSKFSLDLVELLSILFIPSLLKTKSSDEPEGVTATCVAKTLNMILFDVTGSSEPKPLTIDLIDQILTKYGETHGLEGNEKQSFLQSMLLAATSNENENPMLDTDTFIKALTNDLSVYDINYLKKISSNFQDVFGNDLCSCGTFDEITVMLKNELQDVENSHPQSTSKETDDPIRIKRTAKGFDYIAGTYACMWHVLVVWVFFVFSYLGYIYGHSVVLRRMLSRSCVYEKFGSFSDNGDGFRCSIETSILTWLTTLILILAFGFSFVVIGSLGYESNEENSYSYKYWIIHVSGTILLIGATIVPPILWSFTEDGSYIILFLRIIAFTFGCTISIMRLIRYVKEVFDRIFTEGNIFADALPSSVIFESKLKQASALKVSTLQQNALSLHSELSSTGVIKAYFGQGLKHYDHLPVETMRVGGIIWAWKIFFDKTYASVHGLWFSARALSTVVSQLIIIVFVLITGISFTQYMYNNWLPPDQVSGRILDFIMETTADFDIVQSAANQGVALAKQFLVEFLGISDDAGLLRLDCFSLANHVVSGRDCSENFACQLFPNPSELCVALEQMYRPQVANLDTALGRVVSKAIEDNISKISRDYYPRERYMVVTPLIIFTIFAFITSVYLSMIIIPSLTTITLKLRNGCIPTLSNEKFWCYHNGVVNDTFNRGTLFWGDIAASFLIGGLLGLIVFLCLWQVTFKFMILLFAMIIAVTVTSTGLWLSKRTCRNKVYKGFYRTKPFIANVQALFFECLNFALSVATVIIRLFKLVFLVFFWVGRIDQKLLSKEVEDVIITSRLIIPIDNYNDFFMTEILMIESHRHPYIETIGTMYLMKLRHQQQFATKAGNQWRILFVTALMPWMQKYRLRNTSQP